MKSITKKSIHLVAFLIAGFAISRAANADVHGHLAGLATKIDRQADRLLDETRHYRHTANYGRMVAEVAALRAKARHMRITTFTSSNFHHLEEDLRIVDRSFHRVESFFDRAELGAVHGHGHVHGNTRHVKALLNSMEDTIHHMQEDVASMRRSIFVLGGRTIIHSTHHVPTIYGGSLPVYGSPSTVIRLGGSRGHHHSDHCQGSRTGGGLQINGRNMSFRIRF